MMAATMLIFPNTAFASLTFNVSSFRVRSNHWAVPGFGMNAEYYCKDILLHIKTSTAVVKHQN